MTNTPIRDKRNMIIGWCKDTGDKIIATHRSKGYVGYYGKSTDITFDKTGMVYCYGNGAQCLIREADK